MEEKLEEVFKIAKENQEAIKKNSDNINNNFERINKNSYALEILRDYKKDARRWFIAFIVMSILFLVVCVHHFIV